MLHANSFTTLDDSLIPIGESPSITASSPESSFAESTGTQHLESQPDLESSSECNCMVCLGLVSRNSVAVSFTATQILASCRFPDCDFVHISYYSKNEYDNFGVSFKKIVQHSYFSFIRKHECQHFRSPEGFSCRVQGCKTTVKKFEDLKRHSRAKHCKKATKFPCPEIGCKYSGDNGFKRKDKMRSHYHNIHERKMGSGKSERSIEPKGKGRA